MFQRLERYKKSLDQWKQQNHYRHNGGRRNEDEDISIRSVPKKPDILSNNLLRYDSMDRDRELRSDSIIVLPKQQRMTNDDEYDERSFRSSTNNNNTYPTAGGGAGGITTVIFGRDDDDDVRSYNTNHFLPPPIMEVNIGGVPVERRNDTNNTTTVTNAYDRMNDIRDDHEDNYYGGSLRPAYVGLSNTNLRDIPRHIVNATMGYDLNDDRNDDDQGPPNLLVVPASGDYYKNHSTTPKSTKNYTQVSRIRSNGQGAVGDTATNNDRTYVSSTDERKFIETIDKIRARHDPLDEQNDRIGRIDRVSFTESFTDNSILARNDDDDDDDHYNKKYNDTNKSIQNPTRTLDYIISHRSPKNTGGTNRHNIVGEVAHTPDPIEMRRNGVVVVKASNNHSTNNTTNSIEDPVEATRMFQPQTTTRIGRSDQSVHSNTSSSVYNAKTTHAYHQHSRLADTVVAVNDDDDDDDSIIIDPKKNRLSSSISLPPALPHHLRVSNHKNIPYNRKVTANFPRNARDIGTTTITPKIEHYQYYSCEDKAYGITNTSISSVAAIQASTTGVGVPAHVVGIIDTQTTASTTGALLMNEPNHDHNTTIIPPDRVIVLGQDVVVPTTMEARRNISSADSVQSSTRRVGRNLVNTNNNPIIKSTGNKELDTVVSQIMNLPPAEANKLKLFLLERDQKMNQTNDKNNFGITQSSNATSITTVNDAGSNVLSLHPAQIQQLEKFSKQTKSITSGKMSVQTDDSLILSRNINNVMSRDESVPVAVVAPPADIPVIVGQSKHDPIDIAPPGNSANDVVTIKEDAPSSVAKHTFSVMANVVEPMTSAIFMTALHNIDEPTVIVKANSSVHTTDVGSNARSKVPESRADASVRGITKVFSADSVKSKNPNGSLEHNRSQLDEKITSTDEHRSFRKVGEQSLHLDEILSVKKRSDATVVSVADGSRVVYIVDTIECNNRSERRATVEKDVTEVIDVTNTEPPTTTIDSAPQQPPSVEPKSIAVAAFPEDKAIVNELTNCDEEYEKKRGTTKGTELAVVVTKFQPVVDEEMSQESKISSGQQFKTPETKQKENNDKVQPSQLEPREHQRGDPEPTNLHNHLSAAPKPEDFNGYKTSKQNLFYDGSRFMPIEIPDILPVVTAHSLLEEMMSLPSTSLKNINSQLSQGENQIPASPSKSTASPKRRQRNPDGKRKILKVVGIPVETITENSSQISGQNDAVDKEVSVNSEKQRHLETPTEDNANAKQSRRDPPSNNLESLEANPNELTKGPVTPGSKSKRTYTNKVNRDEEAIKKKEQRIKDVMKELDTTQPRSPTKIETKVLQQASFEPADRNINLTQSVIAKSKSRPDDVRDSHVEHSQTFNEVSSEEAGNSDPLFKTMMNATSSSSISSVRKKESSPEVSNAEAISLKPVEAQKLVKDALKKSNTEHSLRDRRRRAASSNDSVASSSKSTSSNKSSGIIASRQSGSESQAQQKESLSKRKQFLSGSSMASSTSRHGTSKQEKIEQQTAVDRMAFLNEDDTGTFISYRTAPLPSNREGRLRSLLARDHKYAMSNKKPTAVDPPSDVSDQTSNKPDPPKTARKIINPQATPIQRRIRTFPAEDPNKMTKPTPTNKGMATVIEYKSSSIENESNDMQSENSACFEVILREKKN